MRTGMTRAFTLTFGGRDLFKDERLDDGDDARLCDDGVFAGECEDELGGGRLDDGDTCNPLFALRVSVLPLLARASYPFFGSLEGGG